MKALGNRHKQTHTKAIWKYLVHFEVYLQTSTQPSMAVHFCNTALEKWRREEQEF